QFLMHRRPPMPICITTLRALVASGATAEMVLAFIETQQASEAIAIAERRRKERERKRKQRCPDISAGHSGTLVGHRGTSRDNSQPIASPAPPPTTSRPILTVVATTNEKVASEKECPHTPIETTSPDLPFEDLPREGRRNT